LNIVRILGTGDAEKQTLKSTSTIMARSCPSVENAGTTSQKRTLSGENMANFDLNSARSYVGQNVNLHLKDGSVIVNVFVADVQRDSYEKSVALHYTTPAKRMMKICLREIEWAERLDPHLFRVSITHQKRRTKAG